MFKTKIASLFGSRKKKAAAPVYREVSTPPERYVVLTDSSIRAVQLCMAPEITLKHEGIAYLFGLTTGASTVVVGAARPDAHTTIGNFSVSSAAMANVVRAANRIGLQVVGQIHTHPTMAFHSDGDEDGARIAYDGYISIVVPNYGQELPSLRGMAVFFYNNYAFAPLPAKAVTIVDGVFPK